MRSLWVLLRTAPAFLLLIGCAATRPIQDREMAATHYDLGLAYLNTANFRMAIPELTKAVEMVPSDPVYHNALGIALMADRRLDEAIKAFEEAVRADARFSEAKNNLASVYMLKGNPEKARTILLEVLKDPFYPTPEYAYFNLAKIFEQQGKLDQAIREYRRALDIQPDYVEAHNNLGILYLREGKTNLAIREFTKATHLSPKRAIYHRNLGIAYFQAGKQKEARRAFERVLAMEPDSPSAEDARKMLERLER
ncbi:MAG: tetratricopeptide repeat protein [Candidatus Methylomirabilales bacterium]